MAIQVKIDFSDPQIQANPYPILKDLRDNDPVFWNGNAWLITRYEDCVSLFTDPRMSSQRIDATFAVLPEYVQQELQPLRDVLGDRMLLSDPPKHTRLADAGDEGLFCPRGCRTAGSHPDVLRPFFGCGLRPKPRWR